jgi:hypothetical protein
MPLLLRFSLLDADLLTVDDFIIEGFNGSLSRPWFLHLNEAETF